MVRYRNTTHVNLAIKDTNESFSHAHDMGFSNFAEPIKESYSENKQKGVITKNRQKGMSGKNYP